MCVCLIGLLFGYSLGVILFGGFVLFIVMWLIYVMGDMLVLSYYVLIVVVVSGILLMIIVLCCCRYVYVG